MVEVVLLATGALRNGFHFLAIGWMLIAFVILQGEEGGGGID